MSDGSPRLPGQPYADGSPVFREPWEAQAFAITVSLHEQGLFTWGEWAHALGEQIEAARGSGEVDLGNTYYRHWVAALERLVVAKGLCGAAPLTLSPSRPGS